MWDIHAQYHGLISDICGVVIIHNCKKANFCVQWYFGKNSKHKPLTTNIPTRQPNHCANLFIWLLTWCSMGENSVPKVVVEIASFILLPNILWCDFCITAFLVLKTCRKYRVCKKWTILITQELDRIFSWNKNRQ